MCARSSEKTVLIETNKGNIKVKLYDNTPLHRDNFIKLVKDSIYQDLLFHRVINEFMIQGGDINSKNISEESRLGAGDLGYTIPAEFNWPQYFHKKGALSAARTGDQVNPQKASSSSQFYIVTGKKYTDQELDTLEKQKTERFKQQLFKEMQLASHDTIKKLYESGNQEGLNALRDEFISKIEAEAEKQKENLQFPAELRKIYKEQGGTPFLDGDYTVFGEVTEGMEVVEEIQKAETNSNDRPVQNIIFSIKMIEE